MSAFYNEIDPYAAQWLRNLIDAGLIAPGVVDERSIEDIKPEDLRGFSQCHFFAGVGVWSHALRLAGWADDRPVWTGSCPCQPFSAAGQGGGFDDERHLWPAFHHLVAQCRPAVVLGEQVASRDAEPWIDLVQDDLEALGYAVGAVPFPSAGVGAPHIRDRLYWVADADHAGLEGWGGVRERAAERLARTGGVAGGLANTELHDHRRKAEPSDHREQEADGPADRAGGCGGAPGGLADAVMQQRPERQPGVGAEHAALGRVEGAAAAAGLRGDRDPGPVNGFWRAADWLACRDGRWRPVEPGTFPLAHGAAARVGRLRAYGNAINAEAARVFIEAYLAGCGPDLAILSVEDLL